MSIDPGAKGGIAIGERTDHSPIIYKMPANYIETAFLLKNLHAGIPMNIHAYCEQVGGYAGGKGAPGSAMFNFGMGYGGILTALYILDIPVTLVTPKKWQKFFQMSKNKEESKTEWKRRLAFKARQLYPQMTFNQDVADAVLIWHYAKQMERTDIVL